MKKLFLCSLFKNVAGHLKIYAGGNLQGQTVAYIPTAAKPNNLVFHVNYTRKLLVKLGLVVEELELTTAGEAEVIQKLQGSDIIYVGGGNTFFLLQWMNQTGAGSLIKTQVHAGKLYVGESAGAILPASNIEYSQDMDDPGVAPDLTDYAGLGMIDFYPLPHMRDFTQRKAVKAILSQYEAILPLVPITNSQLILVRGDEMEVVN